MAAQGPDRRAKRQVPFGRPLRAPESRVAIQREPGAARKPPAVSLVEHVAEPAEPTTERAEPIAEPKQMATSPEDLVAWPEQRSLHLVEPSARPFEPSPDPVGMAT